MADKPGNQPQAHDGDAAAAAAGAAAVPAGLTPEELARILPTDKDKIAEWVLQQEQLLEALKLKSASIADVVVFRGYLQSINEPIVGKDANGNPVVTGQRHALSRLYFDLEFNEYIEFPREDLIQAIPLVNPSFPLSGVVVWLKGVSRVRYIRVVPARQVSDFLGGDIVRDNMRGNAVPDWSRLSNTGRAGAGAAADSMGCNSNAAPPVCPL